ncbi:MAG: metallophosphoesterase [Candidatus Adiutrix sp.]|jgi:predicted MPP superfamily phosphohydrolase|nr:metallophosphoesterase [Candidatus Adiutrix sp.]
MLRDHRLFLFLLICLLGQILAWRLWLRWAGPRRPARAAVHLLFVLFNLGWFFSAGSLYFGHNLSDRLWAWVARPSIAWQAAYILAILPLGLLGSLGLGLGRFFRRGRAGAGDRPADQGRRDFIKISGLGVSTAILGACAWGVVRQGRPPGLERLELAVPGLPPALDGFKIMHLTDIHLGLWAGRKELDQALERAAAEKPHLAALTGDLVDRNPDFAKLYREPLKRLAGTPCGVWGVLGNHDHYTGPRRIAELLDGHGLNLLVDRQVNFPDLPLSLIGLDDQGRHQSWLGRGAPSVRGQEEDPDVLDFSLVRGPAPRPGDFTVLLNHRPEGFRQAAGHGCRLYLAGHTHGGQYQVPWDRQLNLAAAFYKYSSGLYREHGAWLNVSRGLASVGIPFRLWAWPQISLITLRVAPERGA